MTETSNNCPHCNRKIMQNISNRCMYYGADLPEEHHLTAQEKNELLTAKLERFKENQENAEHIISKMRQDFAITEFRKSRKQRKQDYEAAVTAALTSIKTTTKDDDSDS